MGKFDDVFKNEDIHWRLVKKYLPTQIKDSLSHIEFYLILGFYILLGISILGIIALIHFW